MIKRSMSKNTLLKQIFITLFSLVMLGGLFNETETVYANFATPGSPTDPDWNINVYNPSNPLSPVNPANQEYDSKKQETKSKKKHLKNDDESSEAVQFIFGCLTIFGLLFSFYYIVLFIAESNKL